LENKLLQLERKVGRKIVRKALRNAQKAMIPTIKGYLAGISKGGGMAQKIAKALTVRAQKRNPRGTYSVHVTIKPDPSFISYPKGSFSSLGTGKTSGKRSYIPAAIEFGHGKNKEQAARPYIRPAADATIGKRIKILTKEVAAGMAKIWGKK
jgi:hypothetical protein